MPYEAKISEYKRTLLTRLGLTKESIKLGTPKNNIVENKKFRLNKKLRTDAIIGHNKIITSVYFIYITILKLQFREVFFRTEILNKLPRPWRHDLYAQTGGTV